jgi:uncharacterized protein YegL
MKKNRTELVFILDRSGSMEGLEKDTIGGFNSMLKKQKAIEGECRVTTVLFDHTYQVLHSRIELPAVAPLTEKDYTIGGSTALLDAIGRTIHTIGNAQKHTAEAYRANHVIFVIITDGLENSSTEYSYRQISHMIKRQKEKYGWEFIFLGANIDAEETAGDLGISPDCAADYVPDGAGTRLNYKTMSETIAKVRITGKFDNSFLEDVRRDKRKRG